MISAGATRGEDKHYKTIYATLGRQLYDKGLPQAQKSIVDEEQVRGIINYKQENQVKAVKEIVDLVAVDQPIAVVTRLINTFNNVLQCKKKSNENLNTFASKLEALLPNTL